MAVHILLVEDDKEIITYLSEFLQEEGFVVTTVSGQKQAVELVEDPETDLDLVLMDVSLEEGNGFSACAEIKAKSNLPVIFLTASGDEYSVVTGLDLGAHDYIGKPFRPRELVSRIRSVLRRSGHVQSVLELGDVSIDATGGTVRKAGQEIFLSALEYRLLLVFAGNKGKVLSRGQLLEEIWDAAGKYVNDNTLVVYIKRLREKIEDDPGKPQIIKTVRGLGYRAD